MNKTHTKLMNIEKEQWELIGIIDRSKARLEELNRQRQNLMMGD